LFGHHEHLLRQDESINMDPYSSDEEVGQNSNHHIGDEHDDIEDDEDEGDDDDEEDLDDDEDDDDLPDLGEVEEDDDDGNLLDNKIYTDNR